MSAETRVLRPYHAGEAFQRALSGCELVGPDRRWSGGDRAGVELHDYLNFPFAIEFGSVPGGLLVEAARESGLSLEEVDLVVLVTSPRLRMVDVAFRTCLSGLDVLPDKVELTRPVRPRAFSAPHSGANIQVNFCLNTWREPRLLSPWRLGTWLGREEFAIRSTLSESGFTPLKLTDADRERLELPKDTSRFATLEDQDPFDSDPSPNALRLYVDEELLDRLAVTATTPVGRQLQRQLFLDSVTAIVFAACDRVRRTPSLGENHIDDFEGSLIHRVVSMLAGKDKAGQDDRQALFHRLMDEPVTFLAAVEAEVGMRGEILAALEDQV